MLCLLYLFLIVLCGILHKTVEQQDLLSLNDILVVYRKQNRPILVTYRYAQFIEIRINQFLDHLGVYNLHLGYHEQQMPDLLLDIIRLGLEKLIEGFGSVNLSHGAKGNKFITFCKIKCMAGVRIKSLQATTCDPNRVIAWLMKKGIAFLMVFPFGAQRWCITLGMSQVRMK